MWNVISQLNIYRRTFKTHHGLLAELIVLDTLTVTMLRNGQDTVIRLNLIEVVIIKQLKVRYL